MIYIFYVFAAALVWLSYKSFRGGVLYLQFFRTELAKPPSNFTPFATVIAPCRGIDEEMRENLAALLEQDYPAYEVIFVVDDERDPSISIITELVEQPENEAEQSGGQYPLARLIVAPKARNASQKVENLREAVLHADSRSEVFVFVDSDARPGATWLRHLVAPLEDDTIGASTGYRWFIAAKPTFATELNSAWNASIASALGANTSTNFCWGGSMAFRRDVFEKLDIRGRLAGTLSDDFTVTRAMNEAKLPVVFVPQALTASIGQPTLVEMLEFTTRQMKITRTYAPKLWAMSFIGSGLFCSVMLACIVTVALQEPHGLGFLAAVTTMILVTLFSIGKAYLRLKAVRLVLTEWDAQLRRQTIPQLTLFLLAPFIFFYNSLAASFSRRVRWRGTTYLLKSHRETVIIAD